MGGGTHGNFGNTKGSSLDALSNLLSAASLIPGVDTVADALAIPVDIARGDWVSAGLDLLGIIPFAGEVADTAKIARVADNAIDAAKVAKRSSNISNNAKRMAKKYPLSSSGFFGSKGKNTRVFKSNNPLETSADFYKRISSGGIERTLPNGKGVQTNFKDGSSVVYRVVTKTADSPAVEIKVTAPKKVKSQKIHFIKE